MFYKSCLPRLTIPEDNLKNYGGLQGPDLLHRRHAQDNPAISEGSYLENTPIRYLPGLKNGSPFSLRDMYARSPSGSVPAGHVSDGGGPVISPVIMLTVNWSIRYDLTGDK